VTQEELFAILKEVVVAAADHGDPAFAQELAALRARVDGSLGLDSPLSQFGWDSIQMTWVLVRLEERLDVDTSTLSLFNMFTVGDLVRELLPLVNSRARPNA
jgi:acyl carrier protein